MAPAFATYVTYSDTFGKPITEADLVTRVETLSLNDCLQSVGKLSHLLASQDPQALSEIRQFVLAGLRTPGAAFLVDGMVRYGGRRLVFAKQLMALARLALLHAEDRPPDSFDEQKDRWRFVEALLGVLDVYGREESVANVQNGVEAEEWMASFRLRRVGMPPRLVRQSIVRAVRIFIDLPQQQPDLVTSVSPTQAFEAAVGVPLERYLAICFAAITRFSVWDKSPDSWLLSKHFWVNSTVTDEEFTRTIATVAATPSQLRHAFQSLMERGQNSIDDIRPFILHPLIELEAGIYTPVDVEALGDTLIGDGLFWRLKPAPAASQQEKSDFGETLGHLLEQHCLDVAESVYGLEGSPRRLFAEFKYSEGDGPDLVIADDRAAAFIEIGIDRPNLRDTVIRGDLASYDGDVQGLILPRAEQLDRKIQHALDGTLGFQGAPADCLHRIHPVICFWDGFPLRRYLYQRIENAVQTAGFLKQPEVAPLSIISVQELEQLLGLVSKGESLTDVLRRHVIGSLRDEPLNDFLHETFGRDVELPPALAADFAGIASRLAAQLFGEGTKR